MGLLSFGRRKEEAAGDDSVFAAPAAQDAAGARPKARRKGRAADPIDPVLPEKQRARRRLVGAVALVLAAVIGLPMILDPEPKPLPTDISIDIPAKDKARPAASASSVPAAAALDQREEIVTPDSATAPANAKPGVPAAAAGAAVAGAAAAANAAKPDPAKPEAKVEAKSDAKADAKADAKSDAKSDAKADNKVEAKADSKSPSKAEAKPEPKADAHKADDARARSILDGQAQADKHETYMVQVAALASADKVRELQNKLKAAGIKSQTQKVATQSGERIRVRVGPLPNRSEAEKMRSRLNKLGLNGTLVPV